MPFSAEDAETTSFEQPRLLPDPGERDAPQAPCLSKFPTRRLRATPSGVEAVDWPSVAGYELVAELGRGGMGVVYLARQVQLKRVVALKMLLATTNEDPEILGRFRTEAEAVAQLKHPNIVQIYDIGETRGRPYFALEYVEGGSLQERLHGQPQSPAEAAALLETLARAIHHAHQEGIIHRDLKPGNVLLTSDGTPKIVDFGLARQLDNVSHLTRTGLAMGTPSYMAPEQAMARKEEIGVATDVYGLGAVFYELLTGRPPFRGPNEFATLQQVILLDPPPPHRWQPGIPRDLETICLKCLEKAPARRYASTLALAEELRRFQEGKPIVARPVGRLERALKWARRRPAVAGLLAGLILATLFGFAGILRGWQLAEEHGRAEASARHDAEAARRDAIDKLWGSLVAQTRAGRWSGQVGRRFAGLDALNEAAQLDLPAGRSVLELRNEAAACLALIDLRPGRAYEVPSPLSGVAFDESFTHYATSTLDGTLLVRDAGTDEEVGRLPGIGAGYAYRLGFSPDGRYLAAVHLAKSRLAVWEWRTGQNLFQTEIGSHFAFSPESGRLAFDSKTHGPRVIDLATGQVTQPLPLPRALYALAWHPDGRQLAAGCRKSKGRIVLFDATTGQEQQSWEPPGPACQLAYAPDGRRLAGACENGLLYVWDATSGAPLHTLEGHQTEVVDVTFDHAGRLLLSAGWDDHFRLWDSQTGEPLLHLPGPGLAQFRRDDQVLAHTRVGNRIQVWELSDSRTFRKLRAPADGDAVPWCVDFSPDGRWLVSGHEEGVRLWPVAASEPAAWLHLDRCYCVFFHPVNGDIFACTSSGTWRWPLRPGARAGDPYQLGPAQKLAESSVLKAATSADGQRLVGTEWKKPHQEKKAGVLLLDPAGGAPPVVLGIHPYSLNVAVSPDGRYAASGAYGSGEVVIWDVSERRRVRELPVTEAAFVAFSPDGAWLVTGECTSYRFWHVPDGAPGLVLPRDPASILAGPLAFAPNGRMLAVAPNRRHVQLVEPTSGKALADLTPPGEDNIESLAFSKDSCRLAAACKGSQTIHLWDIALLRPQLDALGLDWPQEPLPLPILPPAPQRVEIINP